MKVQFPIQHKRQITNFGCVYASLSMVFGKPESFFHSQLRQDKAANGTYFSEVAAWLVKQEVSFQHIVLHSKWNECWWIPAISSRYPVLISGEFKIQGKRGRPAINHHAFVVNGGKLYDPADNFPIEWECLNEYTDLIIKSCIVIFQENPNYGKNKIIF